MNLLFLLNLLEKFNCLGLQFILNIKYLILFPPESTKLQQELSFYLSLNFFMHIERIFQHQTNVKLIQQLLNQILFQFNNAPLLFLLLIDSQL
jgi:hypothetical protein